LEECFFESTLYYFKVTGKNKLNTTEESKVFDSPPPGPGVETEITALAGCRKFAAGTSAVRWVLSI